MNEKTKHEKLRKTRHSRENKNTVIRTKSGTINVRVRLGDATSEIKRVNQNT